MTKLYLVHGHWSEDGDEIHGNTLGIFRDVNKAEDAMIATARKSFDYYNTPAKYRRCDYYDPVKRCDAASNRLYCVVDDCDDQTELVLTHYETKETFTDKAYVIWGTEESDYWFCFYPMKEIFNNGFDAIGYAAKLGSSVMDKYGIPSKDRVVRFIPPDDIFRDNCIFEIGDKVSLTTWFKVKELTIQ